MSLAPLDFAEPKWGLGRRLSIARDRNANHRCTARCQDGRHRGRGTARRDRMEIQLRAEWKWFQTINHELAGNEYFEGRQLAELLWKPIDPRGATEDLPARSSVRAIQAWRARIVRRWNWLVANGPDTSGWALAQAKPAPGSSPHRRRCWTPFYVPRRSWNAARRWCREVRKLRLLLLTLAKWWESLTRVIPQHPPSSRKENDRSNYDVVRPDRSPYGVKGSPRGPRPISGVTFGSAM